MLLAFLPVLVVTGACFALPLLGAVLTRQPLGAYLQLPLREPAWDALPFDAEVFAGASLAVAALVVACVWRARPATGLPRSRRGYDPVTVGPEPCEQRGFPGARVARLPSWGWLGALLALAAPALANGLGPGLGLTLLVAGLALLLNADVARRTGSCLLTKRPGYVASLLPAGVLLGWLFHYLNLYLQLWHYPGATSTAGFVIDLTLGYAVYLPAMLSLRQWLGSFPHVLGWTTRARPMNARVPRQETGWGLLVAGLLGLIAAAALRDWIWPLTWLAPLLLALGIQVLGGKPGLLDAAAEGDWSRILLPALAALLLGVTAQLWNTAAGPVWAFSLPLIDSARILGLAAPAYAGFVPLGLLGVWMADQLARPWHKRPLKRFGRFPIKVVVKR